ncbi:MAG: hypothetical protein HQM10_00765 [Candidatus Riflebacteria bacterium]|nr:hypothetical protein [Candidatus Riflebacteria bacterium]
MIDTIEVCKKAPLKGFSLVEAMMGVLLMGFFFFTIYQILSHSRHETEKISWMNAKITELRNSTRQIGAVLKKASYPMTIVRGKTGQQVISYKEWREYDFSGRLSKMEIKESQEMDLVAAEGITEVQNTPRRILLFPACTPEKEIGGYCPGTINWYELHFEPENTGASRVETGCLRLVEREENFDSRGKPKRVYSMNLEFSPDIPVKSERIIVRNVKMVEVASFSTDELRGILVDSTGNTSHKKRRRSQLMLKIKCTNPQDPSGSVSDQCIVVSSIDFRESDSRKSLKILRIAGGGSSRIAEILYDGKRYFLATGQKMANVFMVTAISIDTVTLKFLDSGSARSYKVCK